MQEVEMPTVDVEMPQATGTIVRPPANIQRLPNGDLVQEEAPYFLGYGVSIVGALILLIITLTQSPNLSGYFVAVPFVIPFFIIVMAFWNGTWKARKITFSPLANVVSLEMRGLPAYLGLLPARRIQLDVSNITAVKLCYRAGKDSALYYLILESTKEYYAIFYNGTRTNLQQVKDQARFWATAINDKGGHVSCNADDPERRCCVACCV